MSSKNVKVEMTTMVEDVIFAAKYKSEYFDSLDALAQSIKMLDNHLFDTYDIHQVEYWLEVIQNVIRNASSRKFTQNWHYSLELEIALQLLIKRGLDIVITENNTSNGFVTTFTL